MPNQTKHERKVVIDEMEVHGVHTLRRVFAVTQWIFLHVV